ncbi:MAG: DnaD domain protein [Corallococcus sp.]|nr:DnaD domain protein [Corallococcus sp.]
MPFFHKDKPFVTNSYTVLENKFVIEYLPNAPENALKAYILGLTLAEETSDANTCASVAKKLDISEDRLLDIFKYWEEMGLVEVIPSAPPQVVYLPLRDGSKEITRNISAKKYKKFSAEIQKEFHRMIEPEEYNSYYGFLEDNMFDWDALVLVARYCVDWKGDDIGANYILTVARSQMKRGATSTVAVAENLGQKSKYDADLEAIFKVLKIFRKAEYTDREMYEKWTQDYGFSFDTIVKVAKKCNGGIYNLDALLATYYGKGKLDAKAIAEYDKMQEQMRCVAKAVVKNLGLYYQTYDAVIDEYIVRWQQMGFEPDTVELLSKYCFRNGIRTLKGLNDVVNKFHKLGCINTQSIDAYLNGIIVTDAKIKEILEQTGTSRNVIQSDRNFYGVWTETWGLPQSLILYAAQKSAGTQNPMRYLNKILSEYKTNGITTVSQAEQSMTAATVAKPQAAATHSFEQHKYTDEQLNALFTNLEDLEI